MFLGHRANNVDMLNFFTRSRSSYFERMIQFGVEYDLGWTSELPGTVKDSQLGDTVLIPD